MILARNKSIGGVAHLNQVCGTKTTRRRTLRWLRCVVQCLIDVTAFYAIVLCRKVTDKQSAKRRQFLKMLDAVQSFAVVNLTRVETFPGLQIHQQHHKQLFCGGRSLTSRTPSADNFSICWVQCRALWWWTWQGWKHFPDWQIHQQNHQQLLSLVRACVVVSAGLQDCPALQDLCWSFVHKLCILHML